MEIRLLHTRADGRSLCLPAHSDAVSIRAIDLLQEAVRCADAPGLKCVDSPKKALFRAQTAPVCFLYANQDECDDKRGRFIWRKSAGSEVKTGRRREPRGHAGAKNPSVWKNDSSC